MGDIMIDKSRHNYSKGYGAADRENSFNSGWPGIYFPSQTQQRQEDPSNSLSGNSKSQGLNDVSEFIWPGVSRQ